MTNANPNIDTLLNEVGAFGRYQVITTFLICIPVILSAMNCVNFMFVANTLIYR